ncbi:hypothetical protein ABTP36_19100, partial [Acinetobacter baumannii]
TALPVLPGRETQGIAMEDDVVSDTANGILRCLHFLAQEAADLNLQRTLSAIQLAAETIVKEAPSGYTPERAGAFLH